MTAGIKLAGETLGSGLQDFLGDRDKMVAATATLTAMALGIYTAKTGTGVIFVSKVLSIFGVTGKLRHFRTQLYCDSKFTMKFEINFTDGVPPVYF